MEETLSLLIPALGTVMAARLLLLPLQLGWKAAVHSGCGFLCLWLLNLSSGVTGIVLPINAVTVLTAGTLGLPGIGLITALALL